MGKQIIHNKIYFILILGIAFFIPVLGKLIPPLITLLFINWLIEGRYLKTVSLLFKERARLEMFSFSILYFCYLLGLIYSSNLNSGLFDLEVKLSIFIFPLIFATSEISSLIERKIKHILRIFVFGCFVGTLVLLVHALYKSEVVHSADAFYYSELSWIFSPSYMAMYLTFSVSILLLCLIQSGHLAKWFINTGIILLILYFFVLIFLLSSKAGLLGLLISLVIYSLFLIFKHRQPANGLALLGATILLFYVGLKLFPYTTDRIFEAENDLTKQRSDLTLRTSTDDRKATWTASINIIKENWLFGVGTGDVKDKLMQKYQKINYSFALIHKLNCHNQYLQTFIAIGLMGLLTLFLILFIPGVFALRDSNILYFLFLLIFSMNIFVESMFETQAGVVFYAFFNMALLASRKKISLRARSGLPGVISASG